MALRFLNNGYFAGSVGIGTVSPSGKLEIASDSSLSSYITQYTDDADGAELVIRTARGTQTTPVRYNTNDSAGRLLFQAYTSSNQFEDAASIESVMESGYANAYGGLRFNYMPTTSPFVLTEGMRLKSNGNVGIGTQNPTSKLHINQYITNPDLDLPSSFAVEIDSNHSGSAATTGDREQGGLYIDVDSSTTGGNTGDEHRVYGIYSTVNHSGDADRATGIYTLAEQNTTAGSTAYVLGGEFIGVTDGGSGAAVNTVAGVWGTVSIQDATPVINSYGGYFRNSQAVNRTGSTTSTYGLYTEVELNSDSAYTNIYGQRITIDVNTNGFTANNIIGLDFSFTGETDIPAATDVFAIRQPEDIKSYFQGNFGIGTSTPDFKLQVGTPSVLSNSTYSWPFDLTRANSSTRGFSIGVQAAGGPVALGNHNGDIILGQTFGVDANGLPAFYETMRVKHDGTATSGKIGINDTSPDFTLDVGGTLGVSDLPFNTDSVSVLVADETLGADLVTNGDFATNTDWTEQGGAAAWSIANGKANCVVNSSTRYFEQPNVLPSAGAGDTYKVVYTISGITQGQFQINVGGYGATPGRAANGTYAETFTTSHASSNNRIYLQSNPNTIGSIDNISVQLITSASNQIQKRELGTDAFISNGPYLPLTAGGSFPLTGALNINLGSTNVSTIKLRRDTTGDSQIVGDIEFDTTAAEGTDDRIALIRAETQNGDGTTRGGQIKLYTRLSGSANFNTTTYDTFGNWGLPGRLSVQGTGDSYFAGDVAIAGVTNPSAMLQIGGLSTNNTSFNVGGIYGVDYWTRSYSASNTNILSITKPNNDALEDGGAYRVTGHIPGTGTDQSSRAVFWNQDGTWYCNLTSASGTSSNSILFLVDATTGLPSVKTYHANNYGIRVWHERINLAEQTGTDNSRHYFGTDSYMSQIANDISMFTTYSGNNLNGKLGVGIAVPGARLDVANGNAAGDAALDFPVIRLTNTTASSDWDVGDKVGAIEYYTTDASGNAPYVTSFINSVNETVNGTLPSGALVFGTANGNAVSGANEKIRLSEEGSLIFRNFTTALATPTTGYLKEMFIANVDGVGTFASNGASNGAYGSFKFITRKGDSSDPIVTMTLDSSHQVGIGIQSPNAKLQVAGGIQMADDTDNAGAAKAGTMRYRTGTEYVEVTGAELISSTMINGNYSTFDGASSSGFHAINSANSDQRAGTVDEISFVANKTYRVNIDVSVASGSAPFFRAREAIATSPVIHSAQLVAGSNIITFTSTITITGLLEFSNSSSNEYTLSNVSLMEVTAEDASYADMCMQTGASEYEWVNIVRNTY